ncbi:MAG: phosphatidate cytidylyltransferase [Bacteroidaceae bacterium]|nr:phosphatidate cytidylyltransferase [Bacteroidaceae bacterium]
MKNILLKRTITGALFVAIIVSCTLYSPLSFGTLFLIISAMTVYEFTNLINNAEGVNINKIITMLGAGYLFLAVMEYSINSASLIVFVPYVLLLLYLLISELYLKRTSPLLNWAYAMLSQLYIALPFSMLNILTFHYNKMDNSVEFNSILPLSIFLFIWANDTGAYCIGSLFGKHKLFERISPHKTWEGFAGGAIFTIITALILSYTSPFMTIFEWIGMAITIVIFGTWGDLTESLLKRQIGVKDSGTFLPGHGGLLDRFDSALMAIPAAVIYLCIIQWAQSL